MTTAVYAGSLYAVLQEVEPPLSRNSASGSNLYGSLGSSGSRHNGGGYKGSKYHKGNRGHYQGHDIVDLELLQVIYLLLIEDRIPSLAVTHNSPPVYF